MNPLLNASVNQWLDLADAVRDRTTEPFSRFALVWVAFNTYYSFIAGPLADGRQPDVNDARDVLALADNPTCLDAHRRLLAATDGRYLDAIQVLVRAEVITGRELGSGLDRHQNDFRSLLKAVYRIRCNLFHGLKRPSDILDRNVVEASSVVVSALLAELVSRSQRRATG